MKNKYVKDYMTTPVITVDSSTTISEAIKILKKYNIGFLPITKNNTIVGVVTDRDILVRAIGTYKLNSKIEKIMTDEIEFVNPTTPLKEAAKTMSDKKIRRLVVINDGKPVGVLTSKNLIREQELLPYIISTYETAPTFKEYIIYSNSNPHDSIKASDYPL